MHEVILKIIFPKNSSDASAFKTSWKLETTRLEEREVMTGNRRDDEQENETGKTTEQLAYDAWEQTTYEHRKDTTSQSSQSTVAQALQVNEALVQSFTFATLLLAS